MIDTAWDEYRGWALRARELQSSSQRWNRAALICAALAAALGAAATQTAGDPSAGKVLSLLAAVAAALTPILGKEIPNGSVRVRPRKQSSRNAFALLRARETMRARMPRKSLPSIFPSSARRPEKLSSSHCRIPFLRAATGAAPPSP